VREGAGSLLFKNPVISKRQKRRDHGSKMGRSALAGKDSNNPLSRTQKQAAVAWFLVLSQYLPGDTLKNRERPK
jgi:hypothetical protein